MNINCELCSEKHHRINREPPCDICPNCDVEENFEDMEKEIEQF